MITSKEWFVFWWLDGQFRPNDKVTTDFATEVRQTICDHEVRELTAAEFIREHPFLVYGCEHGLWVKDVPQPGDVLTPLPKLEPVEAVLVDRRTSQKGL